MFSTFLGGTNTDQVLDMRLRHDWIYLSGELGSEDMPGSRAIKQECLPRGFAVRMSLDGALVGDVHVLEGSGGSIAVDGNGIVHTLASESLGMERQAQAKMCILDAATVQPLQSVSPGQLISIFRPNLADRTQIAATKEGERLPTLLASRSVTFDGEAAPLLYVSERQANAIVPYTLAGRSAVTVKLSSDSEEHSLAITDRNPSVFRQFKQAGFCGSSSNLFLLPPVLIHNSDGTVNDCAHPAPIGSVATIFVNGGGVANPPTTAGLIASERTAVGVGVSVQAGGQTAQVVNFSLDPGSPTGVWRLEFRIPSVPSAGGLVAVTPTIDGKPISQTSFYLFVTP